MKRNILSIGIILVISVWSVIIYRQASSLTKNVTKNVTLSVYKGFNYASEVYGNTTAQVKIVVEKVSKSGRSTIWQEDISPTELANYPSVESASKRKLIIPNIDDKKETIQVTYTLTYNSKGSEINLYKTEPLSKGTQNGTVVIKI